ncbi:tryptophanyl-tRNA synthetase [Spiroplasma corruscae]|uniref:Tryptophan--tRNA ligase n=1 Tax=Spiroplasma corruscae TaxID=216934 RepID=A0A222EQD0_9MOLU|nr:tryptophan--tRNA ligase [Spiroplasma corruscae]ASP28611.1 tryptophanyl-tRNA synthetase [Spiroplasma corruscae]
MKSKKRMVSGITATGTVTLGNYIGAIKNFVKLQEEFEMYIFVANLHAITTPIDKLKLRENIKSMAALYFACGLDPNKVNVFIQSEVLEHTQLSWILTCNSTIGELNRMTQFKDKSQKQKNKNRTDYIPTGLLTYPLLMAADILLYEPDYVPVGKDQKQHIELTRNLAERMNNKYGNLFKIPEEYIPEVGSKIMDLQNPTNKMSKSSENPKSYISLLDDIKIVEKKIKSAVTDSENLIKYDPINKPGVSNLIVIYSSLANKSIKEVELFFSNKDYGFLKNEVIKVVSILLKEIQDKYYNLINSNDIETWLEKSANNARYLARKKMSKVMDKIGLNYK